MYPFESPARRPRTTSNGLMFLYVMLAACALIALRRPDQVMNPEVWNEDGIFVIPQIIQGGFLAIFEPVNGYLIIPSRFITWLSLLWPLEYYPSISTALGILAQAACIAAVAISPTKLPAPVICAILLAFLPMNAEVYVLPQYTFWWTTVLLFLALIWIPGASFVWRNAFIVLGGLSSPMSIILLPLFALRLAITRKREDVFAFGTVVLVSVIQLYFILLGDPAQTESLAVSDILPSISVFFAGWTVFASTPLALVIGLAVCVLLFAGMFSLPREERPYYLLIGLALGGAIASSILRAPIEMMSPTGNGPRYFFLPLVLIAWLLAWLAVGQSKGARIASLAVLIIAIPVSARYFQRGQEALQPWAEAVSLCRAGGHEMPVHHNGQIAHMHPVPYQQSWCE